MFLRSFEVWPLKSCVESIFRSWELMFCNEDGQRRMVTVESTGRRKAVYATRICIEPWDWVQRRSGCYSRWFATELRTRLENWNWRWGGRMKMPKPHSLAHVTNRFLGSVSRIWRLRQRDVVMEEGYRKDWVICWVWG